MEPGGRQTPGGLEKLLEGLGVILRDGEAYRMSYAALHSAAYNAAFSRHPLGKEEGVAHITAHLRRLLHGRLELGARSARPTGLLSETFRRLVLTLQVCSPLFEQRSALPTRHRARSLILHEASKHKALVQAAAIHMMRPIRRATTLPGRCNRVFTNDLLLSEIAGCLDVFDCVKVASTTRAPPQ